MPIDIQTCEYKRWRSRALIVAGISINLAAIYTFLVPAAGNRPVAKFELPHKFGLAEQIAAPSIPKQIETDLESIQAHQQYQYGREGTISLEISYLVDTRGGVDTYLRNYTDISKEAIDAKIVEQIEGVGHHALLSDGDRTYLTSCISPRSRANVTQQQFSRYRYQNDLTWHTGWQWLLGRASIRDRRCLWVLMAVVNRGDLGASERTLATAWQDVYRWWLPNFPPIALD